MVPTVIGVAGGSGSGKTTVVRRIVDSLGPEQVVVLEHDRYYRDRNDLRLEERAARWIPSSSSTSGPSSRCTSSSSSRRSATPT